MTIAVRIIAQQDDFRLDVDFESTARVVALFGPSGAGKTTVLNVIAGLLPPDVGRVVVDGRVLVDTIEKIDIPVPRRRIGYVFQDGRLFPHLNVRRNLLFGRHFTPKKQQFGDLEEIAELLGLEPLLDRRPTTLSGGEKQRVAIGRALLASPRLLLMDEPLAALDQRRKDETLPYIERLRDEIGLPMIYVSHSRQEVDRLASDVVEIVGGQRRN